MCVCVSFHSSYDPYVYIFISFSLGVSPVFTHGEKNVSEYPMVEKINRDKNSSIYAKCEYLSVHNVIGRSKIKNSGRGTFQDKEQ